MKLSLFLKKTYFIFFICVFLHNPLFAQTSKIDSSEMLTLRIDPEVARGASVADFFDEVKFIPLESTSESLFGKIDQLEVTEKCFIIYDQDTRSILIFSKEGKFKAKINDNILKKDIGEKATNTYFTFSLSHEHDEVFIKIHSSPNILYYDLNGKLIKKILSKDDKTSIWEKFSDNTEIKSNYLVKNGQDNVHYEIGLAKDNKEVANYFPFDMNRYKYDIFYSKGESIIDSKIQNERFYIKYYESNIYKITPKKVSLAYHIIFPAINSLPYDFVYNPAYTSTSKRTAYFEKYPKAIYTIGNTYKIGNLLFFKTQNFDAGSRNKQALIYNLQTNALTSVQDLEPDSLSSFLPVTDLSFHFEFANKGFFLYDNQYLYTSYSSLAMFAFKEQSAGKNPQYNAVLSDYFKSGNRKSNPVIIQLKPKKD